MRIHTFSIVHSSIGLHFNSVNFFIRINKVSMHGSCGRNLKFLSDDDPFEIES